MRITRIILLSVLFLCCVLAGVFGYTHVFQKSRASIYTQFDLDVYDIIKENYWDKPDEPKLAGLFLAAAQKATGAGELSLATSTRDGVGEMLNTAFAATSTPDGRKDIAVLIAQIVLYNLEPAGRSELLSHEAEVEFRNTVANVPAKDLYETLGVAKDANKEQILTAYQRGVQALARATSSEAIAERVALANAKDILLNQTDKQLYDQTGMQPTVFMRTVGTQTLVIDMSQVSPATFGEFAQKVSDTFSAHTQIANLIIDLRHNIGGSIDVLPYVMALFLGPNQYIYDFYHQGDLEPQRTPALAAIPQLQHLREIAVLTDDMTQSTAELMTATFKRFHLGRVVGTTTRGWGTIENTFPIPASITASTTYAVLLVHRITLRDDGQPIEGRGVDPDIDVSQKTWKSSLQDTFETPDFISAITAVNGSR